jgi:hypothetical protein
MLSIADGYDIAWQRKFASAAIRPRLFSSVAGIEHTSKFPARGAIATTPTSLEFTIMAGPIALAVRRNQEAVYWARFQYD